MTIHYMMLIIILKKIKEIKDRNNRNGTETIMDLVNMMIEET